jgi:hypothetical protein
VRLYKGAANAEGIRAGGAKRARQTGCSGDRWAARNHNRIACAPMAAGYSAPRRLQRSPGSSPVSNNSLSSSNNPHRKRPSRKDSTARGPILGLRLCRGGGDRRESDLTMSTADVSDYGRVLREILKKHGFSRDQLLEMLTERGWGITNYDLYTAEHTNMSPCNFDLVRGPVDALQLTVEDANRLAQAYKLDPTIESPSDS